MQPVPSRCSCSLHELQRENDDNDRSNHEIHWISFVLTHRESHGKSDRATICRSYVVADNCSRHALTVTDKCSCHSSAIGQSHHSGTFASTHCQSYYSALYSCSNCCTIYCTNDSTFTGTNSHSYNKHAKHTSNHHSNW